jgi:hypothetical protein
MTDLTDPKLALLVARYREWVKKYNEHISFDEMRIAMDIGLPNPKISVTYQGFLDWCIREGIEVPQEDAVK